MDPLTALDRCDRCGAQAYLVTMHDASSLMWCRHHYEKYKDKLEVNLVLDERERLLVKT